MNLRQSILQSKKLVEIAFFHNALGVNVLTPIQGPHTITIPLRMRNPTKQNIDKALKMDNAVEVSLGNGPVRIYMDQGVVFVEFPSPEPVIVYGNELRGSGLAVPIGRTSRQIITGIDFIADPHLLLVGPTNKGKTVAQRNIAYHLSCQNPPRKVRFIISTFKPKDWMMFTRLANTWAVITNPKESGQMIRYMHEIMLKRTNDGAVEPRIFIFLDDLLNLLGVVDVAKELVELVSLGRGAGIHLIIGTQRLGEKGAGGAAVTGNITARLVFATASAQDSAQFTGHGKSGAEKLGRYPGDALFVTDGSSVRVATALVTDADLATLPIQEDEFRPWAKSDTEENRTSTEVVRTTLVPPSYHQSTRGTSTYQYDSDVPENGENGGFVVPVRTSTKLANRMPDENERAQLRRWYEETGSKNEVLKLAWGGVVNESGKTPKTWSWLDMALKEVIT